MWIKSEIWASIVWVSHMLLPDFFPYTMMLPPLRLIQDSISILQDNFFNFLIFNECNRVDVTTSDSDNDEIIDLPS